MSRNSSIDSTERSPNGETETSRNGSLQINLLDKASPEVDLNGENNEGYKSPVAIEKTQSWLGTDQFEERSSSPLKMTSALASSTLSLPTPPDSPCLVETNATSPLADKSLNRPQINARGMPQEPPLANLPLTIASKRSPLTCLQTLPSLSAPSLLSSNVPVAIEVVPSVQKPSADTELSLKTASTADSNNPKLPILGHTPSIAVVGQFDCKTTKLGSILLSDTQTTQVTVPQPVMSDHQAIPPSLADTDSKKRNTLLPAQPLSTFSSAYSAKRVNTRVLFTDAYAHPSPPKPTIRPKPSALDNARTSRRTLPLPDPVGGHEVLQQTRAEKSESKG